MPNITALTSDYDAIERAIRETTRGRWFLSCYLERNRSAETRVLLDAIARLEAAMRDSGHMVDALAPAEALSKVADALTDARVDITRMVAGEEASVSVTVSRFAFGSIPRSTRAATHAIREAAVEIEKAADALQAAGVFQGVAAQITEKADEIIRACAVQEQSIGQMQRLAMLINDIEAEIVAVVDSREDGAGWDSPPQLRCVEGHGRDDSRMMIPQAVMDELSHALSEGALLALGENYDGDVELPEGA
jgi:hypothetical protein